MQVTAGFVTAKKQTTITSTSLTLAVISVKFNSSVEIVCNRRILAAKCLSAKFFSLRDNQVLISVGTIGNCVPTLILQWELGSHNSELSN